MKNTKDMTRRDFMRTLFNSSVVAALAPMAIPSEVYASGSEDFSDYKALVYISLTGGNDAFNTVVPTFDGGGNGYNTYANIRSALAVDKMDLSSHLQLDGNGNLQLDPYHNPYAPDGGESNGAAYKKGLYHLDGTGVGLNAVIPEMAHLAKQDKMAILTNIGTLVEPVTKAQIKDRDRTVKLPLHLFAHNHQKRVQQTGQANDKNRPGWVGQLFDNWAYVNGPNPLGTNISFAGGNHLLVGRQSQPVNMHVHPRGYWMGADERYTRDALHQLHLNKPFEDLYNRLIGRSFAVGDVLSEHWQDARVYNSTNAYGEALFSRTHRRILNFDDETGASLLKQFEAVAKMIDYAKDNGIKRQVFYISLTGFDTHGSQVRKHASLLRELSMGIDSFQRAMEEMGMADKVTSFTVSDFGRTAASNGDGTDHAWAGHNFVVGGSVQGGVYGEMPDLTPQSDQDVGRNGRIIPTLAIDQQMATLTRWFGVDEALVHELFPNLSNFADTAYGTDIGFMKS